MSLETIVELSRRYGADPKFVLAGGGNTSCKDETHLYVKPSGVRLADITAGDFVKMDRAGIQEVFSFEAPEDVNEREAVVKDMIAATVCPDSKGRPSVEAPLHELLNFTYVVHLHPAWVNGLTCGVDGEAKAKEFFPGSLWVGYVDPGFILSKTVHTALVGYAEANGGAQPSMVILQNHGIFVGANTEEEITQIYDNLMSTMEKAYADAGVPTELIEDDVDREALLANAPQLRSWLGDGESRLTVNCAGSFAVAEGPLTPDHIVYAKSFALIDDSPDQEKVDAFAEKHGYKPLVTSVGDKVVLGAGKTYKDAATVSALARDAALVQQLTAAFGGPNYLSDRNREFIENWEVESYRKKVAAGSAAGRLEGKVAVVTGGAQGFGYGIAQGLAAEGATVAIADLNLEGAQKAADDLCQEYGASRSIAIAVNIGDEDAVETMAEQLVYECGGVDLFVANAGVLRAGSVKELSKRDWDFVTGINYSGYFLCVKHIAQIMATQNAAGGPWTDIVQVNSKSGLQGSNRNGAYAGSKFGTIGLTQSFAMELVDDHIKVNSICPGNFFDGPLWSDPDNGLFVQYLRSGKVPGATTVQEVREFYEKKIPMGRGCFPMDIVRAITYVVEQQYETGQAIPVTGGQVMLN